MNHVINKLIIELNKVVDGDPWYGASLKSIFNGIDCRQAIKKISKNTHSIAEITLHILGWIEEVVNRLEGSEPQEPARGDWRQVDTLEPGEWEKIVNDIFEKHKRIVELVTNLPLEKFEEQVGTQRNPELGTGFSFREMLVGLMEHNVYHGGQIALLKKMIF